MAARETPAEQIERLLRSGDLPGAARVAGEMIQKLPTSPVARLGRCRAYLQMGMFLEAEQDLDVALRSAPRDELANYLRGQLDIRTGKDAEGIARLKPIALGRGTCALEAMFAVLDICYHSNRRDEWRELMKTEGAWRKDIRAEFHGARLLAATDPLQGAEALRKFLRGAQASRDLRRHAGFEAAGLYDKAGEYRTAFETARETHALTGDDFDIDMHMKPILEQLARIEKGENWITPSVERVQGVVMLVSLPRSGSTGIPRSAASASTRGSRASTPTSSRSRRGRAAPATCLRASTPTCSGSTSRARTGSAARAPRGPSTRTCAPGGRCPRSRRSCRARCA